MKQENNCSACCACLNICPKNAISMQEDLYGFVYPQINEEKCIHCGLCDKVCDNISTINKNKYQNSYAIQSKNWNLSKKSSSGGMFAQLAKYILLINGVVFGCSMEKIKDKFEIKHISIEKEEDLYKLQGSKYVQSDIGFSYKKVKEYLEQERFVLFSGTPCQIAGLKTFLRKDYKNLLTVDLSCTGTPNRQMFNDYVSFLEKNYKKTIKNFEFRNKEKLGWICGNVLITFDDNSDKILYNNLSFYQYGFLNGIIERESCYNCEFTSLGRCSDITIADCWGIEDSYPELLKTTFEKDKGISLVLINSNKGFFFFEQIKENLLFKQVDAEKMKNYNNPLRHPLIKHSLRETYLEAYNSGGYENANNLYYKNLGWKKYYNILKNNTPKFIKEIIRKNRRRKNEN